MITVIGGIRDLAPRSEATVVLATLDELAAARELRFGGALGVDTVALAAAGRHRRRGFDPKLVVYVPGTLAQQPAAARRIVSLYADRVVELGLPVARPASYRARNDAMLDGADRFVACTDCRTTGGTSYTIGRARRCGLEVSIVLVESSAAQRPNFETPAPVFAVAPYGGWRRDVIHDLKLGLSPARLPDFAREIAGYIVSHDELSTRRFLVPMPRRIPGQPNDLLPLLLAVGGRTGQSILPTWLTRITPPRGGVVRQRRTRHTAEEHAESFRVTGDRGLAHSVILFDNVITSPRGTMAGAQEAVLRDTGVAPVGLAALWSESLGGIP